MIWASNIAFFSFFFSSRVFFHGHWQLTGQQGKGGAIFYSTLPLPPAHEHSKIYLQLCTWDDYHIFLIARLVFTRLLLDNIYYLIELLFDWLMMWYWFLFTCLLNWFYLGSVTAIWHEKPVDSSSYRISSLYYKRID